MRSGSPFLIQINGLRSYGSKTSKRVGIIFILQDIDGLFRQNLCGTGTGTWNLTNIVLNTSHCNLCGNLKLTSITLRILYNTL